MRRKRDPWAAVLAQPRVQAALRAERAKKAPDAPLPPRAMNSTETRFAQILTARQAAGEIRSFAFEAETLALAYRCEYTPDFRAEMPDGTIAYFEVKGGHWWEDARVKWKVAARLYPDRRFFWCQWKDGEWRINECPHWTGVR